MYVCVMSMCGGDGGDDVVSLYVMWMCGGDSCEGVCDVDMC